MMFSRGDDGRRHGAEKLPAGHLVHEACRRDVFKVDVRGPETTFTCAECGEVAFRFFRGIPVNVPR